jgi:hypothetical protein
MRWQEIELYSSALSGKSVSRPNDDGLLNYERPIATEAKRQSISLLNCWPYMDDPPDIPANWENSWRVHHAKAWDNDWGL